MKSKLELASNTEYLAVLVTPASTAHEGAIPHLVDVAVWPINEFEEWAKNALTVLRDIRRTFSEPGDLAWRTEAAEAFENNGIYAVLLFNNLKIRVGRFSES